MVHAHTYVHFMVKSIVHGTIKKSYMTFIVSALFYLRYIYCTFIDAKGIKKRRYIHSQQHLVPLSCVIFIAYSFILLLNHSFTCSHQSSQSKSCLVKVIIRKYLHRLLSIQVDKYEIMVNMFLPNCVPWTPLKNTKCKPQTKMYNS